jgi:soluble lytic murein transglycosylase-like protein
MRFAILAGLLICLALPRAVPAQEDEGTTDTVCRVDAGRLWFVTEAAADLTGVDPDLVSAIAWVESHNCDRAVSPAGAAGLMQLMPETAAEFGVADRFDPAQSALGGAKFLADLERAANGDRMLTLAEIIAAYNAGLMLYLAGDKTPRAVRRVAAESHAPRPEHHASRPGGDAETFAQLNSIRGARALADQAPHP